LLNKRLIHIDPAKAHFARSPMAHMHIQGRIVTIFQHILQKITGQMNLRSQARGINTLEQKYDQEKTKQPAFMPYPDSHLTEQSNGVAPQFLMSEIAHRLPPGTRFFADAGNSIAWTVHYLHSPHMRKASHSQTNWFRTSTQFASMGWAIGTAVGAAIGDPNNPVVCITGDGSLLMNGQELTVAVAEQLNIIFLVLNDSAYGMVKHGQRMTGAEPIAFGLPRVDFFAMAKAMGAKAYRLHNHSELKALDIEALVNSPGPTLLDVHIDPEATPPMGTRVKVLGGAS
jgi:acetolactate synthase-1/2/3 large subunit